jgi:isopentenyl diphosphate isomerase/L-lactate dehydrogenase-like FMN-dependent dehydrogenase
VLDCREPARRRLPRFPFKYIDGGGVAHTLRLVEAETRIAMALTGTVSVTDINANIPRSAVEFNRGR